MVLRKLREFQDLGHTVVLIIGDYTARVGDPSGRSSTRPQLDPEEIDRNAETFQAQAFTVLDRERTEVRRNGEWLDMPMEELFRLARTATVAQLLERDDFAKRYAAGEPISILELLYPLLQGYDSVAVRADVELGGTDQKFNLLLARDDPAGLRRRAAVGADDADPARAPTACSRCRSRSGNYVGVTEPPEEVFGKLMRVPDAAMPVYYELLLDEPFDEGRPRGREPSARWPGPSSRASTARTRGRAAEAHFDRLHVQREAPDEVEEHAFGAEADGSVHLPALLAEAFGISRSEARRLLGQGGVKLDGEPAGRRRSRHACGAARRARSAGRQAALQAPCGRA